MGCYYCSAMRPDCATGSHFHGGSGLLDAGGGGGGGGARPRSLVLEIGHVSFSWGNHLTLQARLLQLLFLSSFPASSFLQYPFPSSQSQPAISHLEKGPTLSHRPSVEVSALHVDNSSSIIHPPLLHNCSLALSYWGPSGRKTLPLALQTVANPCCL